MKKLTCSPCFWTKVVLIAIFAGLVLVDRLDAADVGIKQEPGTLDEALAARKAAFTEQAPLEVSKLYDQGVIDVAESGVLDSAKKTGDAAPDFTLPHATGETVTLSELLKQGPVVLTWYRGGWCPYCNIQLHYLQQKLPAFEAAGATLVAISPELPDKSLDTKEKGELDFYVLSDTGNKVADAYGIRYKLPPEIIEAFKGRLDVPGYNGDESWTLPLSATYVIAPDGTITYAYLNPDYRERAEPAVLVEAVQMHKKSTRERRVIPQKR